MDTDRLFGLKTLWKNAFKKNEDKKREKDEEAKKKPTRDILYSGRCPAAAAATGNKQQFIKEVASLINDTLGELTAEQKDRLKKIADEAAAKAKAAAEAAEKEAKAKKPADDKDKAKKPADDKDKPKK